MILYTNFLGVDIGKSNFVVSIYGTKIVTKYKNLSMGILKFIEENKDILSNSLLVAETTGGYELELIYTLIAAGYKVHNANLG